VKRWTAKVLREMREPVDFLFIDGSYGNYYPCLMVVEHQLTDGAVVVADNVGVGAADVRDYLDHMRSKYRSKIEWFDSDLPRGERDEVEVTIIERH
jgi:predicted O-methyltransferase YrrM